MPPAVSVCVPTYNGEEYLAECLESVLAQTFADLEVLVVDDGSSDGTVALAERYARADSRVRVLRNPRNLGLVGNWNRCAELARGEWVKYVFQDDLVAATCVERLVAAARDGGRPVAACARDFLFAPGTADALRDYYLEHHAFLAGVLRPDVAPERFSEIALDHPVYNHLGEPTVVLLRRDVFARFGPFNERMVQIVDAEYWLRVGTAAGVAYVPEALATFRVHAASTSARNNGARLARTRLDPLVLRHEYAFGPAYASLREVCRRARPGRDLAREFWDEAYRTLVVDGVAAQIAGGEPRTRAEAARVFAAYPRLRLARLHGLRLSAAGYLGRHAGAARTLRAAVRRLLGRERRLL